MSYSFLLFCVGVLMVLCTTFPVVVWSQATCVLTAEEVTLGYVSEIYDSLMQTPNEPIGWYAFNCGMCGIIGFYSFFRDNSSKVLWSLPSRISSSFFTMGLYSRILFFPFLSLSTVARFVLLP